jgi:hypothetical protein
MSADPNWLLSTTAQSAAALVGIVGGLLVSRMVSTSGERSSLGRQRNQLRQRVTRLTDEVRDLDERALRDAEDSFIFDKVEQVIDARGESVDLARLIDGYADYDYSGDDFLPIAGQLVERVRDAFEQCESVDGQPDRGNLAADGVTVPDGWEYVYETVAERVYDEREPPRGRWESLVPRLNLGAPSVPDADDQADRARWRGRRPAAKDELGRAQAELDVVDSSLRRLGDPRSMRPLLLVLGAFALVGVVQPVAMLALRPVPEGPVARAWVVASFTAALVALLVFLWRESQQVASDGDGDDN